MSERQHVSLSCARGAHKGCRGRVLDLAVRDSRKRWTACACPCPHDRGPLAEEYSRTHPPLLPAAQPKT